MEKGFATSEVHEFISDQIFEELMDFDRTKSQRVDFGITIVGDWKNATRSSDGSVASGRRKKTITITITEVEE